ncbi:hypothetical protein BDN72DRAFT_830720 [Pluteus cervinus]|uniref:Uncharacterized protein n=1 Tax=Pluteus cervinus TaxID=181527 RepID=A0ACD3BDM9_9AGAR|nr:hypothetical protein BDN72DRAFT_830720 [Pluteus cervinus]
MATPSAEDIAIVLGLSTGESSFVNWKPGETVTRLKRYETFQDCLYYPPNREQLVVRSEFCAKYLPATVAHLLDELAKHIDSPNPISRMESDPFFDMVVIVHSNPVFIKYLNSRKEIAGPGKDLAEALALNVVVLGRKYDPILLVQQSEEDQVDQIPLYVALKALLVAICILSKHGRPIPPIAQKQLLPYMHRWGSQAHIEEIRDICLDISGALTDSWVFSEGTDIHDMRKILTGRKYCGFPECDSLSETLRTCKRCQTVSYCSVEHQRAHWTLDSKTLPAHKRVCFRTEF